MIHTLLLPADSNSSDHELHRLGFRFGHPSTDAPGLREATIPSGWAAKSIRPGFPVRIVDQMNRPRVTVIYPPDGPAQMRLLPVAEYLDECIATGTPVLTDGWWATPIEVELIACARASRADSWSAEFTARHCGRLADLYTSHAAAWRRLAARLNTRLEIAA